MSSRLIRLPEVKRLTGLGRSTIYKKVELGEFPQPIKIGARMVAWVEKEVRGWIESRIADARYPGGSAAFEGSGKPGAMVAKQGALPSRTNGGEGKSTGGSGESQ